MSSVTKQCIKSSMLTIVLNGALASNQCHICRFYFIQILSGWCTNIATNRNVLGNMLIALPLLTSLDLGSSMKQLILPGEVDPNTRMDHDTVTRIFGAALTNELPAIISLPHLVTLGVSSVFGSARSSVYDDCGDALLKRLHLPKLTTLKRMQSPALVPFIPRWSSSLTCLECLTAFPSWYVHFSIISSSCC
jgi:hypothetical protein